MTASGKAIMVMRNPSSSSVNSSSSSCSRTTAAPSQRRRTLHFLLVLIGIVVFMLTSFGPLESIDSLWKEDTSTPFHMKPGLLYHLQLNAPYATNKTFIRTPLTDMGKIVGNAKAILVYDFGPCFWVANGTSVQSKTGGEYIWCQSLMGMLIDAGKEVFVTNTSRIALTLSHLAHRRGHGLITIAHWGWQDIRISTLFNTGHILPGSNMALVSSQPRPEIGEDCLIKLNAWGTKRRVEVWPGDLKRYISIYPREYLNASASSASENQEGVGSRSNNNNNDGGGAQVRRRLAVTTTTSTTSTTTSTTSTTTSTTTTAKKRRRPLADDDPEIAFKKIYPPNSVFYRPNTFSGLGDQFARCGHEPLSDRDLDSIRNATLPSDRELVRTMGGAGGNGPGSTPVLPYYVIFGKWGVVADPALIFPTLKNATLWGVMEKKLMQGVVLRCDDGLFSQLEAKKSTFLCVEDGSIFKRSPFYNLLLKNAAFVLGLGTPLQSTTPFEALTCQTSVILPVTQHYFLDKYADQSSQFYKFRTSDEMLAAVDEAILLHQKVKGGQKVSRSGAGKEIARIFAEGKQSVIGLMKEVEHSCQRSLQKEGKKR